MRASINASEAFSPLAQQLLTGCARFLTHQSLMRENKVLLAVIYQPILDIVYTATLERGAYLNQERLCVQQNAPSLSKSTICRVLSYGMHNHKLARQVMNTLYGRTRRLLDTWAPSLDWCMLASGKTELSMALTKVKMAGIVFSVLNISALNTIPGLTIHG